VSLYLPEVFQYLISARISLYIWCHQQIGTSHKTSQVEGDHLCILGRVGTKNTSLWYPDSTDNKSDRMLFVFKVTKKVILKPPPDITFNTMLWDWVKFFFEVKVCSITLGVTSCRFIRKNKSCWVQDLLWRNPNWYRGMNMTTWLINLL